MDQRPSARDVVFCNSHSQVCLDYIAVAQLISIGY